MSQGRLYMCVLSLAALMTPPAAAAQDATPEPPATAADTPSQEAGGRLVVTGETVVVVGNPDMPTRAASVATKTETPVIETPRSVSVTERRTLDDRLAVNIADAHSYTAGLMPADERGPAYSRGFFVGFYDVRRDGLRTYSWSIREPVGVERVQYLRGPAAILYGDGSPGGVVNLVLRRPLPSTGIEATVAGGTSGFGRVTGDVTGPLVASRRLRYRVIGAAEWDDNDFDNDERRLSLLPMVSFDLGRTASLHIDSEVYHQQGRGYRHTIPSTPDTQRGDFSRIPWDLNTASPDDGWSGWNVSPGARLDMTLGEATSLHAAARYTRIDGDIDGHGLIGLDADGRTTNRFLYREISTWHELQSDTFMATAARTGRIDHRLVMGLEAGLSTADSEIGVGAGTPVDIVEPDYPARLAAPSLQPTRYDVTRFGVYAQDQMQLHRSLIVVPSVRWSRIAIDDRVERTGVPAAERDSSEAKVSPGIGIVVLPQPWFSAYFSATRGFEPPAPGQYREDGRALDLADTASIEGGVKAETRDGRLSAALAVFRVRRTNVPEADGLGFYRQIGEGRSRGLEAELNGQLAPGLAVQAAYAWVRSEITRAVTPIEGNELPNAPHHNASVWTRYRLTSGPLSGTMVAAGVVYVSDRFLAGNNITIAPAYTRLDISGSYDLPRSRWKILIAIPNATNVRYTTSGTGQALFAGAPRRLVLQLATAF